MTTVMLSNCPTALSPDQEPLTGSKYGLLPGPGPVPEGRPQRPGGGCRRGTGLPPRWRLAVVLLGAALGALLIAALVMELVRARAERDALRADVEDMQRRLHDRDLLAELRDFEEAVYEEEAAMDEDDSDSESEGDSEGEDDAADSASWQDYDDDYLEYTLPAPVGANAKETPDPRLREKYAGVLAGMADKLQQGAKGKQQPEDANTSSSSSSEEHGGRRRREISSASESGVPVIDESYGAPLPRQYNASSLRLYETLAGAGPTLAPTESPIKKHHRVSPLWSQPLKKYQPPRPEETAGHRGGTPAPPPLITRSSRVMDTDGDRSVRIPYNALQHRHPHRHHQRLAEDAKPQELRLMPEAPTPAPMRKAHLAIKRKKLRALSKRKHSANGTAAPHHGAARLLPAAHFYGDSANYTVGSHDRYRGNGILRPANKLFTDWTPSKWVHELGMSQHFSYEAGAVTVKRTGLYYVYAQIFYLDERSDNGFKVYVNDEPVMQCSLHIHIPGQKSNTCFTASVVYIPENSRITVKDIGDNRYSVFEKSRSFFGLMKLGNTRLL